MLADGGVYAEAIAHGDGSDMVTLLYARVVDRRVTSAYVRDLSPAAARALLRDLEAARARGADLDGVIHMWAAIQGLDMA